MFMREVVCADQFDIRSQQIQRRLSYAIVRRVSIEPGVHLVLAPISQRPMSSSCLEI